MAPVDHMRTELRLEALRNAVMRHRPPKGLIHHSDHGSQYCSEVNIEELEKHGMVGCLPGITHPCKALLLARKWCMPMMPEIMP